MLQESLDGKLLLAAYFLKDGLEPTDINTLCHLVISSCILNGFPSKKHIFEKLKEKILELFPNIDPVSHLYQFQFVINFLSHKKQ